MILDFEQIKEIVRGAVRLEESDDGVRLFRFTEAQANAYLEAGLTDFYDKTFAAAGVRLAFRTDSTRFAFDYVRELGYSRNELVCFDVYEDGAMIAHCIFDGEGAEKGRLEVPLAPGETLVEVYMPHWANLALSRVELDDGATLAGAHRKHTLLCLGDSITHGYNAEYPSLTYTCRLARMLDADEINKGIAGDNFFPAQLCEADPVRPDIVTVAYGTNDWSHCPRETMETNSRALYSRLSQLYPAAHIYAVTPLWRLDWDKQTPFGAPLPEAEKVIRKACEGLANVTVIKGWKLTPAVKEFYQDLRLHPNDLGFGIYAENLYRAILQGEKERSV